MLEEKDHQLSRYLAAKVLGMSQGHLVEWTRAGYLTMQRDRHGTLRWCKSELQRFRDCLRRALAEFLNTGKPLDNQ